MAADEQVARDVGRLGADRVDFSRIRYVCDHGRRIAVNGTEEQVARAQLLGAGDRDRAQAHQRGHREEPLRRLRQHDDHVVAMADAEVAQRAGPALRILGDLANVYSFRLPGRIDEEQTAPVALGQFVKDVAREIKCRRDIPFESCRFRHARGFADRADAPAAMEFDAARA